MKGTAHAVPLLFGGKQLRGEALVVGEKGVEADEVDSFEFEG
jgi:hypothetical protein